jgi:hypothetical protein
VGITLQMKIHKEISLCYERSNLNVFVPKPNFTYFKKTTEFLDPMIRYNVLPRKIRETKPKRRFNW